MVKVLYCSVECRSTKCCGTRLNSQLKKIYVLRKTVVTSVNDNMHRIADISKKIIVNIVCSPICLSFVSVFVKLVLL